MSFITLEKFMAKYHPEVYIEHERACEYWESLKPGDILLTLRSGFGGAGGKFVRVTDKADKNEHWECKYLEDLAPDRWGHTPQYVLMKEDPDAWRREEWWQCVVKVDHEHIMSLPFREREQYINDVIAGKRVR